MRLLIDQGSEFSFISEETVRRAKLKRYPATIPLFGIGGTHAGRTRGVVTVQLHSIHDSTCHCNINAYVLSTLTAKLPPGDATVDTWPHISGLSLADPEFDRSGLVNIIIGSDHYGTVIMPGLIQGPPSTPVAQQTIFGWILSGAVNTDKITSNTQAHHCTPDHELQELISRFWELEELPASQTPKLTDEEEECERHFLSTHIRDTSGRYTVRLPLKCNPAILGDSRTGALYSLNRFFRRFTSNPTFHKSYSDFIKEYKSLGHLVESNPSGSQTSPEYYLPHLGVLREDSRTTKLRVVFNGSSRTNKGHTQRHSSHRSETPERHHGRSIVDPYISNPFFNGYS